MLNQHQHSSISAFQQSFHALQPLKVLMLSKACYVGAYRKKLVELAALGIDLTLIVPPYWRFGDRRELLEPGNTTGYRTIIENPLLNGYHHLHFYPRLGRILDEVRPDLVHLDEEPYDWVTVHALREVRRRRIPAVFFTWQNIERSLPLPFERLRRFTLNRAAGAIAGNLEAAEHLRRRGFTSPLAVIPQFGVDPADYPFQPADPGPVFRIGYLGRLWSGKGLDILFSALGELAGEWRLDLAGAGPDESQLRAEAARFGDRVRFLGSRPSTEVAGLLHSLDVLVLPSRTLTNWKEQFGRVLIEAMACGVPVVGSDSGEIPNVIGNAGIVVPEGDPRRLAEALNRLRVDSVARAELAAAGRARVLAHYTQRRIAEQTVELYRRVKSEERRA